MKYQIWYKRLWPLTQPDARKDVVIGFAKRLRKSYGDTDRSIIRIRKVD